ncbi:MAG: T9SS type A sorting domain-containing protein, partial [Ignavibacteria bacterium]|nr:T9SS type A sorting domain-containing protein [Ignavibacteria bacterium]
VSNKMVYDDALKPPFTPTLWGATADFNNTTNTKTGNRSVKVTYLDWGAFDLLSGTWNSEVPIDPADYDSLVADVYPTSGFEMEVAFYNSYTYRVTLTANKWNRVSVPLAFSESFTRFYFRRNYSGTTVVYFDNIEFVGSGNVSTRADGDDSQPAEFALDQNYPNPFNPSTTISYTLPRSSNVELAVYNVVGQHVATLVQGYQEAGKHTVEFAPEMLAGGIYFYKLKANGLSLVRKMILLK